MASTRKFLIRTLRAAALLTGIAVLALAICEGWIRYRVSHATPGEEEYFLPVRLPVSMRVFRTWSRSAKTEYLNPPYTAFANIAYDDPERLKTILPFAKQPAGHVIEGADFLTDPGVAAHYTAHINSLGFRGPERPARKPPHTFRILCLGEYQTFGHGVNDDETFEAQLEKELNARGLGYRFEVWNAGMHASTAIMGYAFLMQEALKYQFDFVLLEYGLVDIGLEGDIYARDEHKLRGVPRPRLIRSLGSELRPVILYPLLGKVLDHSYFAYKALDLLGSATVYLHTLNSFRQVMGRMIEELKDRKIRVALLDQVRSGEERRGIYKQIAQDKKIELWSATEAFDAYPPSKADFEAFDATPNFSTEFGAYGERLLRQPWYAKYRPYMSSFFQLNAKGYRAYARAVADHLAEQLD